MRGRAKKSMTLIEAMVRILGEIQPASVRAVCYQLFNLKLIPNMSNGSTSGTTLSRSRAPRSHQCVTSPQHGQANSGRHQIG